MAEQVRSWWFRYTFDNPLRRLVHQPKAMPAPGVGPDLTQALTAPA